MQYDIDYVIISAWSEHSLMSFNLDQQMPCNNIDNSLHYEEFEV